MGSSPDNVLNRDMWDGIVRLKGRPWAEQWRAQNNLQVEGTPQYPIQPLGGELPPTNPDQPPVYPSQPLDAAQPQGVPTMDETEDSPAPEAGLDALAFANMTSEDFSRSLSNLYNQASKLSPAMGQTDYEAARQKLTERRYGPSRAEQLFALSAALAKPTYAGNRFGQILGNVAPALADAERARREATEARETALEQLKQQYLTGQNTTERQKIEAQLGVLKTAAPVIAARTKPTAFKSVIVENGVPYDPTSGEKIVQPNEDAWLTLRANPTRENYNNFINTFGPRFQEKAARIVGFAVGGS